MFSIGECNEAGPEVVFTACGAAGELGGDEQTQAVCGADAGLGEAGPAAQRAVDNSGGAENEEVTGRVTVKDVPPAATCT
ncbi:hypothetical protein [Streptomyces soliscabiei]|uniref:hypothetical protein n=1 Tax=Streptomyces soliscabiei TaxID=588897 RepID=UPI0029AAD0B4|nr:hypothetical protein [Streptomyces sp. NY05-11A]MDX2681904.1 hypothetical protein [Streptomyces sp. NY05-11A]